MVLPPGLATRLYAAMTGCFLLLLAALSGLFFIGLAWIGVDPTLWLIPPALVATLGLVMLSYRWLRRLLPIAAIMGMASAGFWAWAWATSEGLGWAIFVIPIGLSLGATALALGTLRLLGRTP